MKNDEIRIKKFEVGKTYKSMKTNVTITILKRTEKMCFIETHSFGSIDSQGSGMRKIKQCFTNDNNYDLVEMIEPWGRFNYSIFANNIIVEA